MPHTFTSKYAPGDLVNTRARTRAAVNCVVCKRDGVIRYIIAGSLNPYREDELTLYVEPEPKIIEPTQDYGYDDAYSGWA